VQALVRALPHFAATIAAAELAVQLPALPARPTRRLALANRS
jgi:hypothetical protein